MRTIRTKVYTFNELNKEGQETAILLNSDINVDHDWWNFTYQDAKEIGLKLMGFDLDYRCSADGVFIDDAYNCANKIIKNHGEDSDSHKLAEQFIKEWDEAITLHSDGKQTDKVMESRFSLHKFPQGHSAPKERFSKNGGCFNSRKNSITNLAYLKTPFEFYFKITDLNYQNIDSFIDDTLSSVNEYREWRG